MSMVSEKPLLRVSAAMQKKNDMQS
jgi:hypothetical protein